MTDKIKQGMKIEISDVLHPYKLWVATVRAIIIKTSEKRVFHYESVLKKKYNTRITCIT